MSDEDRSLYTEMDTPSVRGAFSGFEQSGVWREPLQPFFDLYKEQTNQPEAVPGPDFAKWLRMVFNANDRLYNQEPTGKDKLRSIWQQLTGGSTLGAHNPAFMRYKK